MDNSKTYDILRSLFEEQFISDQIVFSQNILGELFLTEKTDFKNLSIQLNIGLNELIEYKELGTYCTKTKNTTKETETKKTKQRKKKNQKTKKRRGLKNLRQHKKKKKKPKKKE